MVMHSQFGYHSIKIDRSRERPGLCEKGPQGEGRLVELGHQDHDPALPEDADHAQASSPPLPPLGGEGLRDIQQGAFGDHLLGYASECATG
jgi:hypothetical protein